MEIDVDHENVKRYWNGNAETWTKLARAGYDVYRDYLNTPAFFQILPEVKGLNGLDIGCGEGHNTRLLAQKGAHVTAIDISDIFTHHAKLENEIKGLKINTLISSAISLPFTSQSFDFATGFMSFMDIKQTGIVIGESYRILKPNGFLQFSITHPCYDTPHRRQLRNEKGLVYAIEVGDYFHELDGEISEWLFSAAPAEVKIGLPTFKVPRFTRILSSWINIIVSKGFLIERMEEPRPSDEVVKKCPNIQDAQVVPYFLHIRVRKPK
jgi:ubiquinone/menaquinone biosynthesis C-methylase UbiE